MILFKKEIVHVFLLLFMMHLKTPNCVFGRNSCGDLRVTSLQPGGDCGLVDIGR